MITSNFYRHFAVRHFAFLFIYLICHLLTCDTPQCAEQTSQTIHAQGRPETQSQAGSLPIPEELSINGQIKPLQIYLPADYDQQPVRRYPLLLLLQEDSSADTSSSTLHAAALESIIHTQASHEGMDLVTAVMTWDQQSIPDRESIFSLTSSIIEAVDGQYRTVPDPRFRAVAGAGQSGCLASFLTWSDDRGSLLSEPALFGMSGSVDGNYTGTLGEQLGSFTQLLEEGRLSNENARKFYTFMRSATDSPTSRTEEGANDVISSFIRLGAAYGGFYYEYYGMADETVLDLQIVPGGADDYFIRSAFSAFVQAISEKMMRELLTGTLTLSGRALPEGTKTVQAEAELIPGEDAALFFTEARAFPDSLPVFFSQSASEDPASNADAANSSPENPVYTAGPVQVPLQFDGHDQARILLQAEFLGMRRTFDTQDAVLIRSGSDAAGEQFIDLMGEWYFSPAIYVKSGELPQSEEYRAWEQVIPCLGWWDSRFSRAADMRAFTGYAWYVKDFEVPESYHQEGNFTLALGGMDEADICFVNGQAIGSSGLDPETWRHTGDCWDQQRIYAVDSSLLNFGGMNTVIVLVHNESGDGGWYDGHPCLYAPTAYEAATAAEAARDDRYESIRITADDTEVHFLVCLPETYSEPENADRHYPVVYLLHQLNSSSRSYVLDQVDVLIDQAVRDGVLDDLILVIPDSTPQSWWINGWESIVAEQIVPYMDEHYRTAAGRENRFIAGASMGGHGAFHIGLKYPDIFSGIISYFGAINMASNPLLQMEQMDEAALRQFKYYFVCGNRDLYKFGIPAIRLDRLLSKYDIPHFFALGEGEHDSAFYLPHFIPSLAYMTAS